MWQYDPDEATRSRECTQAFQFRRLATEAILSRLTETTTKAQYHLVLESLAGLKDESLNSLDAFHRSVLYGRHRCIQEAYVALRLQIQNSMSLRPVPQPAPEPPAPEPPAPPKPRSLSDVVRDFAGMTDVATDEDKPNGE
jgi:hypothetical protein